MSETVLIPGGRDVRATLDTAASDGSRADAVVVACPPHPQQRGRRGDERLTAVSDALTGRGIDCLRFDYGDWDEGYGESTDADNAVAWAAERYERVGLFGFSFGAAVALVTAASRPGLAGVCALAPTARLNPDVDAVAALDDLVDLSVPTQVLYATRDSTADWEPVVERAKELGIETKTFESDHFFVGRSGDVGEAVAAFFEPRLVADGE
ncbi:MULTISPECIES: dienelactone hydrolase family protein [unclassified Halorubrum]|uniref:dienelactone hydrolase family protein n=1 Tax=unclassified Halorubrum TaxID=2642239 RepID=UPI000B981944|nr:MULTISPECIES: dienelactone hydrolase family protein [unclassified Halorubrum]OYR46417.1 alpha/beta hydrolase [Halorubrum sp. Hd13]OYR53070.1 alpha/beta hydrolase [Halorubrum sp. Ea1]